MGFLKGLGAEGEKPEEQVLTGIQWYHSHLRFV